MDLQLYRVDGQNYLVDFRNIGYYRAPDAGPADTESSEGDHGGVKGMAPGVGEKGIGGVSGPFHFLEMACQLIAELASG